MDGIYGMYVSVVNITSFFLFFSAPEWASYHAHIGQPNADVRT